MVGTYQRWQMALILQPRPLAVAGVFLGVRVGLTKLQALTWFWVVPDLMSPHEIWGCHVWLPGSQSGCGWSCLGHVCRVIDLSKGSRVCFILWLAGLGLLITKYIVRSQDGPCCRAAFSWIGPHIFFKGFVNIFSASERCFERSSVKALLFRCWNTSMAKKSMSVFPQQNEGCFMDMSACDHQLCGLCPCRKQNTMLIILCLSC